MSKYTREPIISVLGHVDHGKTSILDYIRDSIVASREAGGITQHIGATDIPFDVIEHVCGGMIKKETLKIPIRGLLFVDTPGHEAFSNLRRRGGSVADLAVLVIDINEGLKPQTVESIEILKGYKTPFVIAANKVDMVPGWAQGEGVSGQSRRTMEEFNKRFYSLVADLSNRGFESDIYNKITDFTHNIAVVPVSAKTGEGIKDLLMMLIGLSQAFLKDKLTIGTDSPAKGTILEVKETKGLGTTIDAIIYDGTLKLNDPIVVAANQPIVTKVKALLQPNPLDEMRDPRKQFKSVKEVVAASGVKIVAQNIDDAMPGGPIYVGGEELVKEVKEEIGEVEFKRDEKGIVVKADTLGSLEAMIKVLEGEGIPVKSATIGKVSKHDIIEASVISKEDKYMGVVMAFNAQILKDAERMSDDLAIPVIESKIIYKIIEEYQEWVKKEKEYDKKQLSKEGTSPAKFKILPNHIFRSSKPAIVGVEILEGTLVPGSRLMSTDGKTCGRVKSIQSKGKSIPEAQKGEQIAVSIDDGVAGKDFSEEDILYTFLSNEDLESLAQQELKDDVRALAVEIKKLKR